MGKPVFLVSSIGAVNQCRGLGDVVLDSQALRLGSPSLDYNALPPIWANHAFRSESINYLHGVLDSLGRKVGNKLNEMHGVTYSESFWGSLLRMYLGHYLHILFDRRQRLKVAEETYGADRLIVVAAKSGCPAMDTFADFIEFSSMVPSQVSVFYGMVGQALNMNVQYVNQEREDGPLMNGQPNRVLDKEAISLKMLMYVLRWSSLKISHWHKKRLLARGAQDGQVLVDCSSFDLSDIYSLSRKVPITLCHSSVNPVSRHVDRFQLLDIAGDDDFELLAIKLLPSILPRYCLEYFESYIDMAREYGRFRVFFADNPWSNANLVFSFSLALASERGGVSVTCQHGCGYGQHQGNLVVDTEMELADHFLTWGWEQQPVSGKKSTHALSHPQFHHLLDTHAGGGADILWIATGVPMHDYRIGGYPFMADFFSDYLNDKSTILEVLDPEVRRHIVYRPYRLDGGYRGYEKGLFLKYPGVKIRNKYILPDLLPKAKLFISDHQGTGMLYALLINTPTILYWRYDPWLEKESEKEYFDALRQAKILFHDAKEAAFHLNAVWPDIAGWWNTPGLQAARMKFVNRHCKPNPNWIADVSGLLNRLVGIHN